MLFGKIPVEMYCPCFKIGFLKNFFASFFFLISEDGNANPLQYSCLGNLMDRGAWRATVHRVTKESDVT